MPAWATKATTFSTWLADLFLDSINLQKFVHGDIFRHHSPGFDKREIGIRSSSRSSHMG